MTSIGFVPSSARHAGSARFPLRRDTGVGSRGDVTVRSTAVAMSAFVSSLQRFSRRTGRRGRSVVPTVRTTGPAVTVWSTKDRSDGTVVRSPADVLVERA